MEPILQFSNLGSQGVEGEVGRGELVLVVGGSEGGPILSEIAGVRAHDGTVVKGEGVRTYWVGGADVHLGVGMGGLSTGERRKLSISEALESCPDVIIAEQWTKGLDTETVHTLLTAIKTHCKTTQTSFICTQYHMTQAAFTLYDTVLLLSTSNDQIFYGPTPSLLPYIQALGYTPSPPSRSFIPHGLYSVEVDGLHENWKDRERAVKKRARSMSGCSVVEKRSRGVGLLELLKREITLQYTVSGVLGRVSGLLFLSVIGGVLFADLGTSQVGGYSRMALLFGILVAVITSVFPVVPDTLSHIPVFIRQKQNRIYPPHLWAVSKTLCELPLCLLESITLSLPLYFSAQLDGALYPHLLLVLWLVLCCSASLVRLVTFISNDLTIAQTACITLLVSQLIFCGFFIPKDNIPSWWIVAYYISPYGYAYESLVVSQFYNAKLHCSFSETLPPWNVSEGCAGLLDDFCGVTRGNGTECEICALKEWDGTISKACSAESMVRWCGGVTSGYCPEMWENGDEFIEYYLSVDVGEGRAWVDVGILLCFFLTFTGLLAFASHRKPTTLPKYNYNRDEAHIETRSTRLTILNDAAASFAQAAASTDSLSTNLLEIEAKPALIAWDGITMMKGRRTVLDGVKGWCEPGAMVAVIGGSGSGKTALLNAVSKREKCCGVVKVNGIEVTKGWRYGYVLREDVHDRRETTIEALAFAAKLKYSYASFLEIVMRVATLLCIEQYLATPLRDLPPEIVRLVTVGVELVSGQSAIFLDEPTAGLDPTASLTLVRALRRVACYGCSIVCTLHQPSKEIFSLFDRFTVLSSNGRTLFTGSSKQAWDYLQGRVTVVIAAVSTPENIADNFLSVVAKSRPYEGHFKVYHAGVWGCCGVEDPEGKCGASNEVAWEMCWSASREAKIISKGVQEMLGAINGGPAEEGTGGEIMVEFKELLKRRVKCYIRYPHYVLCRVGFTTIAGLIIGTSFWDLGHTQRDLHCYVSVVAASILMGIVPSLSAVIPIFDERAVLYRETLSSMYSARVSGVVNIISELPMLVTTTVLWCGVVFWMCNLPGEAFTVFTLGFGFFSLFQSCFGQLVAVLSPTLHIAEVVLPLFSVFWTFFAGFFIPIGSFPAYLKLFYYANPYTLFLRSMVANLLHYRTDFYCEESEIILIPPEYCPSFITSEDWSNETTATLPPCKVCPFTNSRSLLDWYDWSYDTLTADVAGLALSSIAVAFLYVFVASKVRWAGW